MKHSGISQLLITLVAFLYLSTAAWAAPDTPPCPTDSLDVCFGESAYDTFVVSLPNPSDPNVSMSLVSGPGQLTYAVTDKLYGYYHYTPGRDTSFQIEYRVRFSATDSTSYCQKYVIRLDEPVSMADQYRVYKACWQGPRHFKIYAIDPESQPLEFAILSGPGSIANDGWITYTPDTNGVYHWLVQVNDACSADTAHVYDSVTFNSSPAIVVSDSIISLCSSEEVCFDVVFSDPDGDEVWFEQVGGPGSTQIINDSLGRTCFTPALVDSAWYTFIYSYLDNCEGIARETISPQWLTDSVRILVLQNRPPVIYCPTAQEFFTCETDTFCFTIDAVDPEMQPMQFSVLSGNATVDEHGRVCFEGSQSAQFDVVLRVVDECGRADTCTVPVTINGNRPPVVQTAADFSLSLCASESICFSATADDPDFDLADVTVNFGTWDDATDRVCFTADTAGLYRLIVTATDSCGASDADTTSVTVTLPDAPVVDLGADFDAPLCGSFEVCLDASVTADNIASYILPDENIYTFNPSTGKICFTPDTAGVYTVVFGVVGDCDLQDVDTVNVTVSLTPPPFVHLGNDFAVDQCVLEPICVDVQTSANYSSLTTNLGAFNAETGEVCFTPTGTGNYQLIVTVADTCGSSADTVNIAVTASNPPVITLRDTTIYLCYAQYVCLPLSVTDPDNDIDTITVNRGIITDDGRICFPPYTGGVYDIIVTAIDDCGNSDVDTCQVTIITDENVNIQCPRDTTVRSCALVDTFCFPVPGIPEGAQVTVTGINTRWDAANQQVCFWSQCSNQNRIRMTITTPCSTYHCEFTVTVQCNSAPVVFLPPDASINVCSYPYTYCFPVGISDVNHNIQTINVTGGVYNPRTGRICVNITGPGPFTIIATVTDSCGLSATDRMVINAHLNTPPDVSVNVPDTAIRMCEPIRVCLPVTASDIDGQQLAVAFLTSGFSYNSQTSEICFTPDTSGHYCGQIVVQDACGTPDTAGFCVDIVTGNYVSITCPDQTPLQVELCAPGPVCVPLAISGAQFEVVTTLGAWADNQLCFNADTAGTYNCRIIGSAECNADTCNISIVVDMGEAVALTCPSDTTIFHCRPDTATFPFTFAPSNAVVTLSGDAYLEGTNIRVPIPAGAGQKTVQLIATAECGADTCSFTVTYSTNRPPTIVLTTPGSVTTCTTANVCVRYQVNDLDGNIVSITAGNGVVGADSICFSNLPVGNHPITATVTDACGETASANVTIHVLQGNVATILCPTILPIDTICASDTICVAAPISPSDAVVTVTPVGYYNPTTGQVCVPVSQTGNIPIRVVATSSCGADTCEFTVKVVRAEPIVVTVRPTIDTLLCLSQPKTICYSAAVTGTGASVTVTSPAIYSNGQICLTVTQPGTYPITITANGYCNSVSRTTTITVRGDQPPIVTVPSPQTFERCADDTDHICLDGIFATDAESTPTLTRTCGVGEFVLSGMDSGEVCFLPDTFGVYTFCFEATDGCNVSRDTMYVEVVEKVECEVCLKMWLHSGGCTPVGVSKQVHLMIDSREQVGGFEILLSFDRSVLTLTGAMEGDAVDGWEYFTYRIEDLGCTSCPGRYVRLVGIAEMNNTTHPPESAYLPNGVLTTLDFYVANDQTLGDQFVPIRFYWQNCGDNAFSDKSGNNLFLDLRIFDAEGNMAWDEWNDSQYPSDQRPLGVGAPDACLQNEPDKPVPTRCIEFQNGGIWICHPDSLDDRGDINLNGLAYEIGDAVVFSNYFIYGLQAFTVNIAGQTAATDVNADGLTLTVADLVYIIRVIVGDADPFPRLTPHEGEITIDANRVDDMVTVTSDAPSTIGGAFLVYQLTDDVMVENVSAAHAAGAMDLNWTVVDNQLRILLFDIGTNFVAPGKHDLLLIELSGSGEIVRAKADVADYDGRPYRVTKGAGTLPDAIVLHQNYPNPFNPTTTISFALAQTSDWTLEVYNVNGGLVRSFNGKADIGNVTVQWDGTSTDGARVASGVYFYRLEAEDFAETKKMILLK